jgi:adenylyltransferase/sulfurtransferase
LVVARIGVSPGRFRGKDSGGTPKSATKMVAFRRETESELESLHMNWKAELDQRAAKVVLLPDEIRRYSRHLLIPEVNFEGQKRIRAARVLIVGMGGLGSPVAAYLAAAGVGNLGLIDHDYVSLSNLQRQIAHRDADIGKLKTDSAAEFIQNRNPYTKINVISEALSIENVENILNDYDIVVDGTDNFPTRYLINDACVLAGKPWVYGSIFQFDGQVSVFGAEGAACYRCLQPQAPDAGTVPGCAEGGVLGALPGIIGSLQATEVLKLICGMGDSLAGRLLVVDAKSMKFREVRIPPDQECAICGGMGAARIQSLDDAADDYRHATTICGRFAQILPEDLRSALAGCNPPVVLDVRSAAECAVEPVDGAVNIPLGELPERLHELDSIQEVVVVCQGEQRTAEALKLLQDAGFKKISGLAGGVEAWLESNE